MPKGLEFIPSKTITLTSSWEKFKNRKMDKFKIDISSFPYPTML